MTTMNNYNNDWLNVTKANGFAYPDPNRNITFAEGGLFNGNGVGISGGSSQTFDWLDASKANGFAGAMNGGRSLGLSTVGNTQFNPQGADIIGHGKAARSVGTTSANTQLDPRGSNTLSMKGQVGGATPFADSSPAPYTGNYNQPVLHGDPKMYGLTTLGLVPDLGLPVRSGLQNWTSGL